MKVKNKLQKTFKITPTNGQIVNANMKATNLCNTSAKIHCITLS